MIVDVEGLPAAVAQLRKRKRISAERLARLVGVSTSTVRRWESLPKSAVVRTQDTFVNAFAALYQGDMQREPKIRVASQ